MQHPTNEQLVDNLAFASGTLGAKMIEIGNAIAESDVQQQVGHLANFIQPILEAPNIKVVQIEGMPEPFKPLERMAETPAILGVNGERIGWDEVTFEFDMTVSSHTEHKTETGVESGVEAHASGGWGPVSAGVSMHVDVSHKDEQTRTTDMSARMHITGKMVRQPLPEGLASMIDTMTEFSRTCNKLRLDIATAKLQQMREQIANEGVPAIEPAEA